MITTSRAILLFVCLLTLLGCTTSHGDARHVDGKNAMDDVEDVRLHVVEKTKEIVQSIKKDGEGGIEVVRVSLIPERGTPYVFVVTKTSNEKLRLDYAYMSDGKFVNGGGQLVDSEAKRILEDVSLINAEEVPRYRKVRVLGGDLWFVSVHITGDAKGKVVHLVRWSPMLDEEYSGDEQNGVMNVLRHVRSLAIPLGLPPVVRAPERLTPSDPPPQSPK